MKINTFLIWYQFCQLQQIQMIDIKDSRQLEQVRIQQQIQKKNKQIQQMIKTKQQINKIKNCVIRKPSLPLKRVSSIQSNYSDQSSCMSDRIIYKKSLPQQLSNRHLQIIQSKNYLSNTFEQDKSQIGNVSQKSLKKIKNKLSIGNNQDIYNKNQHNLTAFQWLIIMRHCFHIQNKRRSINIIKQRTLINYIRNKMYPDSLWTKILVIENQIKISTSDIINTIEKQSKWKFNLDDLLVSISKYFLHHNHGNQQHQSAAETARFTQNMKPNNLQQKSFSQVIPSISQPKFIYKKLEQKSKIATNNILVTNPNNPNNINKQNIQIDNSQKKQTKQLKQIPLINPLDINNFHIDNQITLNISPISVTNQTNNISFSMDQIQHQSPSIMQYQSSKSNIQKQDRFQIAFSGIQSLKQSLQNSSKAREQKTYIINFLQQILNYSIYKTKQKKGMITIRTLDQIQSSIKNPIILEQTQYFYGLKLQNRAFIQKISIQIMQRLFGSKQFTQYFQNLKAIKISQYYNQLPLTLSVLSNNLQILNLSNNNIKNLQFFKQIHGSQLQFINLNYNKINNINQLFLFEKLQEIHIKFNLIDHIICDKILTKGYVFFIQLFFRLKIIDLSHNLIAKQTDIYSLVNLNQLKMINLANNDILINYKSNGFISKQIIVDHNQMYIFSSYTQYKDIAFGTKKKSVTKDTKSQRTQSLSQKENKN